MRIILASASRDRKRCLENAHIPHEVMISEVDESNIPIHSTDSYVLELAQLKAHTVLNRIDRSEPSLIIAADTMVLFHNRLIGKAQDEMDAFNILKDLQGTCHSLLTGVCIIQTVPFMEESFVDQTQVHFQPLSDSEIRAYLSSSIEYQGRAGSYSILDRASLFIDRIEGSPTNVVGLPLAHIRLILKELGISLLDLMN